MSISSSIRNRYRSEEVQNLKEIADGSLNTITRLWAAACVSGVLLYAIVVEGINGSIWTESWVPVVFSGDSAGLLGSGVILTLSIIVTDIALQRFGRSQRFTPVVATTIVTTIAMFSPSNGPHASPTEFLGTFPLLFAVITVAFWVILLIPIYAAHRTLHLE